MFGGALATGLVALLIVGFAAWKGSTGWLAFAVPSVGIVLFLGIAMLSPWGAQTRSSRRGFVFVEQSAAKVAPSDLRRVKGRCGRRIGSAAAIRRS